MIHPMILRIGRKSVEVQSFAQASEIYCAARDASRQGASRWPEGLIMQGDEQIARVSYNGRVWPVCEWSPSTQPIFSPF